LTMRFRSTAKRAAAVCAANANKRRIMLTIFCCGPRVAGS
jgi:hypothetical protein